MLGGVGGAYLNNAMNIRKTTVITMAYMIKNCFIWSPEADSGKTIPAIAAPVPLDIKLKNTVAAIICGTLLESNHLMANTEGELMTKMYPVAHKIEPMIIHTGF